MCRMLYGQEERWVAGLCRLIADPDEVGMPVLDAVEALCDAGREAEVDRALRSRVQRREPTVASREGIWDRGRLIEPKYFLRLPRQPEASADAA